MINNRRFMPIATVTTGLSGAQAKSASPHPGSAECAHCRHVTCTVCEDCSVAKQYSDYWICHSCGELNRRSPNPNLKEVSNGLGQN